MTRAILTLNAGSSSLKFGIYAAASEPNLLADGMVENIGRQALLHVEPVGAEAKRHEIGTVDHAGALDAILKANADLLSGLDIDGVGHRIVHGGMDHIEPAVLDEAALDALAALTPFAPLHQPHNLAGVKAARQAFPDAMQVGCFDTAFHRGHDFVNDTFGLPRRYYDKGVRRYGFHGLSYAYMTGHLREIDPDLAKGRVVIAHLGNGASMCAVHNGRSVASTMGFSALDGLAMGTRCGQLDPGVVLYMLQHEGMDAEAIEQLLYRDSGLKGLSGISNDMRILLASDDPHAAQAIDYYVHRVRRELGAMAACLDGLDGVVFCGGVGENATVIRERICQDMEWLGISIDKAANDKNAPEFGTGAVRVMTIATDEERVIARAVVSALD